MSAKEKPVYRFGGFELDPNERRLLAQGDPVTLTPKVFETLVLLVERAGHAVSKDELMSALWPRGFVHESNLTKHIWLIRKALGDTDGESRFIETLPKLGYRFVEPVQCVPRPEDGHAPPPVGTAASEAASRGDSVDTTERASVDPPPAPEVRASTRWHRH